MSADNVTNMAYSGFLNGPAKVQQPEAVANDVQRFNDTYQQVAQASNITGTEPAAAVQQPVNAAVIDNTVPVADAQERARRALGLEAQATSSPSQAGDKILDGLEGLRQVIETQKTAITQHAGKAELDMMTMVSMQLEVTKYSMLVDVTSKLAGKSTRAFDSLLKNQ